jgi:hypothetical protein
MCMCMCPMYLPLNKKTLSKERFWPTRRDNMWVTRLQLIPPPRHHQGYLKGGCSNNVCVCVCACKESVVCAFDACAAPAGSG